jgi:hypothetical protein
MAYLTLNGTEVMIQSANATRDREPIGEVARTFGGTLKSTVRGYKRTWGPWDVEPAALTAADALEALIGLGLVQAGGDGIGDVVDTYVTYTIRDIKHDGMPEGFERILTLTIQEV